MSLGSRRLHSVKRQARRHVERSEESLIIGLAANRIIEMFRFTLHDSNAMLIRNTTRLAEASC
ncbi:MAG: hypothetical protein DMF31_06765 [Verrucomicrobia bacterium]|nr:MAG: hypothetical protein DMF31_06765 [Verrucomicrobiota bacterium]